MTFYSKNWILTFIFILFLAVSCAPSSTTIDSSADVMSSYEDIESLKKVIKEQSEKIISIEEDLKKYQELINDQSQVLDIYDDNNKNVIEFRRRLDEEVQSVLNNLQKLEI